MFNFYVYLYVYVYYYDYYLYYDYIVAIFYPFSQFCEIDIALLSLQTQPNTAPNLFQRGVDYGKYDNLIYDVHGRALRTSKKTTGIP